MKYRYLFFDLDGTLTNPGLGITNSVIYALNKFGIKENDRESLYRFIGPPLADSFKEFYGFDEQKAWTAVEYYREYFADKGLFENFVYDGIKDLLTELKNRGRRLYVATSKPTKYSVQILEKFELLNFFEYVSGANMDEKNSSKSDIIRHALEVSGAPLDEVLMIGDRHHDIDGAKANNIASVGVLYGYGNREEHENAGADYIIDKPSELLGFV
jgi:phosphoglycolate phosphatase